MADVTADSASDHENEQPYAEDFEIKRMQKRGFAQEAENADGAALASQKRRSSSNEQPRRSSTRLKSQGSFRTARISDGTFDGLLSGPGPVRLTRTGSFARSVSSQATYRDPFNGSLTTSPRTYLRSYSSAPPPLPSSVTSWRAALEEAITSARAPLASLPQTLPNPAKENEPRHSHAGDPSAPCFHCAEAVQARAHEQKLEAAKQAAELGAKQARAELAAAVAREAVLASHVEVLQRKAVDALKAAESAEQRANEEHEAALRAAAEWRKKSLEEARKHADELAALGEELKEARRQGAVQEERARQEAEVAHARAREELKARASELQRAKEKAEAALRVKEEEAKETAAKLLKVDEAVEQRTQELRSKVEAMHERQRLLEGDKAALHTTLEVAQQAEAALRDELEDAESSLGSLKAELELALGESHRWQQECQEAREVTRGMITEAEEQSKAKLERAARPFDDVREELEAAMARALERHGIQPASAGLSDDEYMAAMARLHAQRAQTEKQRQRALAREGVHVAAPQHAASDWTRRKSEPNAASQQMPGTSPRKRAHSVPANWQEAALRSHNRAREDGQNYVGSGRSTVDNSPEHASKGGRSTGGSPANSSGRDHHPGEADDLQRVPGGPSPDRISKGPSARSSARSSPNREEEGSELADSDWGAPRPPRGRTSEGLSDRGRGPLSC